MPDFTNGMLPGQATGNTGGSLLGIAGNGIASAVIGTALGAINDQRQLNQNQKLQAQQLEANKEMARFNQEMQMDLWNKTGYGAQVKQMKEAGINPALLYGGGGAGGGTTNIAQGTISAAEAPKGGGEIQQQQMLGIQQAQLQLLEAQKANIEADTENKKASAGLSTAETANKPLQGENIKADTTNKGVQKDVLTEQGKALELENRLNEWLQNADKNNVNTEGNISETIAGKRAIAEMIKTQNEGQYKYDQNTREKAMNSAQLQEISAKIQLMDKQGMTQNQVLENLMKDGTLKDLEIKWQAGGITTGNAGHMIIDLIKHFVSKK